MEDLAEAGELELDEDAFEGEAEGEEQQEITEEEQQDRQDVLRLILTNYAWEGTNNFSVSSTTILSFCGQIYSYILISVFADDEFLTFMIKLTSHPADRGGRLINGVRTWF